MGITERLEEAQFAAEVADEALRLWETLPMSTFAFHILEADLCRARGVLLAIKRRQACQMVDTTTPACGDG